MPPSPLTASPLAFDRGDLPYPVPGPGAQLRLVFTGDPALRPHMLEEQTRLVTTSFVEDPAQVAAVQPHVVVALGAETIPAGALSGVRALTVGVLAEPLPHPRERARPDISEQVERARAVDAAGFDRLVTADRLLADATAADLPVWRSLPLPVADRFFGPVRRPPGSPRVVYAREPRPLAGLDGLDIERLPLEDALREAHVAVNIHVSADPWFEREVALHLAAGLLVISEQLSPLHGLEPDLDFLEAGSRDRIADLLWTLERFPGEFERVRHRGRMKSEYFRASRMWPRLVHDLLLDVREFGSERDAG